MNNQTLKAKEQKNLDQLRANTLETESLYIIPLSAHSLELSLTDYGKMQTELGLKSPKLTLEDEEMQYVMTIRHKRVLENLDSYLWYTTWAVVHKVANVIIGYIILKGSPNESGEVIIGYVIDEEYRRKGYATESLQKIISWIFENPNAKSIIADTEKDNYPSHRLLEHIGAVSYKEADDLIWWRINKII